VKVNTTAVERGFELAKSGQYDNVTDIKRAIDREGYNSHQLDGRSLGAQLRYVIRAAKAERVEVK